MRRVEGRDDLCDPAPALIPLSWPGEGGCTRRSTATYPSVQISARKDRRYRTREAPWFDFVLRSIPVNRPLKTFDSWETPH